MKTHEIRELTTEELQARGRDLKSQMMHLRIQKATGQMENKSAIGHLKKEVARILTILQERRLHSTVGLGDADPAAKLSDGLGRIAAALLHGPAPGGRTWGADRPGNRHARCRGREQRALSGFRRQGLPGC